MLEVTDDVERISNVGAGLGSLSRILKNLIIFTNLSKKVLEVFAERIFNVVGSLRSLLSLASNRGISNEGTLEF